LSLAGESRSTPSRPEREVATTALTLYSVDEYRFEQPVTPSLSASGGAPASRSSSGQPNPTQSTFTHIPTRW